MKQETKKTGKITRRNFIKAGGTGAAALATASIAGALESQATSPRSFQNTPGTRMDKGTKTVYSVCLACAARCGVRGVVENGKLVNISGNPYHPYNMKFEPITYSTPVQESLKVTSPVCGKALDTPNHIYSPYRLVKPLKRSGPRGSGKFETIEWDQLINEVCEGGKLFSHLGEKQNVEGMNSLISKDPANDRDPSLGTKRNSFVFMTGRLQAGRKEFIDRFVKSSVGSKNRIGHTDICGLGFRIGNWALTGQKQVELKADPLNAEFILVLGANIYEAMQPGLNTYGAMVAKRSSENSLKFSIADPRATKALANASDWLPVKPGKDGALAMGMILWMIEKDKINHLFLSIPNLTQARQHGFAAVSNSSHLVICDPSHPDNGAFLRMKHIDPSLEDEKGKVPVVMDSKKTMLPASALKNAVLEVDEKIIDCFGNPIKVKSSFAILKASAFTHSLAEYAEICGVPEEKIISVAKEFSSHGTRAAVTQYHGAGNYVNGTWAAYSIAVLNALVGSVGMRGGYINGGGGCGSPKKGIYDLSGFPGHMKPHGVAISREKAFYEKTAEYKSKLEKTGSGYPSKRPWFPFTKGGLSVECLSGIDQQYPYPAKVLFTYLYNPVYSTPGGYRFKETLLDLKKTPLHVSMDVAINESNIYADYIVPDLSYAEGHYGWMNPHAPAFNFSGIRSPMVEPVTGKTKDGRSFCTETFLIDLAKKMNLPGFGDKAIPDSKGKLHPLNRAEDFYMRAFANIASNADIPEAEPDDIRFVESNYPVAAHKDILSKKQWAQVCYMLARGGVFNSYEDGFEKNRFKKAISHVHIYNEKLGTTRNTLTGEQFPGFPGYVPPADSSGHKIDEIDTDFPFRVVTYKSGLHTQSRSLWCKHAMEIQPENFIEMNSDDARKLNLKQGDKARLASKSNPEGIQGVIHTTSLVRPGTVAVSFHFGHSQFGGSPLKVTRGESAFLGGEKIMKKKTLIANQNYRKGLNMNNITRLDQALGNTPMVDLAGGIPDFSSTRVKITREG